MVYGIVDLVDMDKFRPLHSTFGSRSCDDDDDTDDKQYGITLVLYRQIIKYWKHENIIY